MTLGISLHLYEVLTFTLTYALLVCFYYKLPKPVYQVRCLWSLTPAKWLVYEEAMAKRKRFQEHKEVLWHPETSETGGQQKVDLSGGKKIIHQVTPKTKHTAYKVQTPAHLMATHRNKHYETKLFIGMCYLIFVLHIPILLFSLRHTYTFGGESEAWGPSTGSAIYPGSPEHFLVAKGLAEGSSGDVATLLNNQFES